MVVVEKRKCGILGATGTVGQKFILLLASHPELEIHALGASVRSAGKRYRSAVRWKQSVPIPINVADLEVTECVADKFKECDVVFSGLDADVAGDIACIQAGLVVLSNAKNYRQDPLVPLIVPLVNTSHFDMIPHQKQAWALKTGFIVTNANCATTSLVVPLVAIQRRWVIEWVSVVTLQAVSGGGYPGVPTLDIFDNVVPYIGGEEEKIEWETAKILGGMEKGKFQPLTSMKVSAACNRVPVLDGHLVNVSIKFAKEVSHLPSPKDIEQAMMEYRCEAQDLQCYSAPKQAIHVFDTESYLDRPQPRLDRDLEGGFAASVGRVRRDEAAVADIKFVALTHNTILGAAGSSVLNAEVAIKKGLI